MLGVEVGLCFLKFRRFAGVIDLLSEPFSEASLPVGTPVLVGEVGNKKLGRPNLNSHAQVDKTGFGFFIQPTKLKAGLLDSPNECSKSPDPRQGCHIPLP